MLSVGTVDSPNVKCIHKDRWSGCKYYSYKYNLTFIVWI